MVHTANDQKLELEMTMAHIVYVTVQAPNLDWRDSLLVPAKLLSDTTIVPVCCYAWGTPLWAHTHRGSGDINYSEILSTEKISFKHFRKKKNYRLQFES